MFFLKMGTSIGEKRTEKETPATKEEELRAMSC